MTALRRGRSVIPLVLGIGMFAVVLAAAFTPNTGAVPAQTSCPYGVCQSSTGSNLVWEGLLAGLIVVAAALLAILLIRRRRRGGPPAGPVEPWAATLPPAVAGAPTAPPPGAAYVEGPEDVGQPMPEVPPGPAPSPEGDIDSLMKELDKISGEILKRNAPKTPPEPTDEAGSGQGS